MMQHAVPDTATEIAAAVRAGRLTARQAVQAFDTWVPVAPAWLA